MARHAEDTTQIRPSILLQSPKVLLIDDDELTLARLESLVTEAGFEVSTVRDTNSAVEALRRESATIVILGGNLRGADGESLCRSIRQETYPGYVYIVLLTSQEGEEDMLAGFDAGADDYLGKHPSPAMLLTRLRTAQRILTLEQSLRILAEDRRRIAMTDGLTGTHNRHYFMRHLGRELKRTHRFGGDLSLLTIDLDHFKQINEQHGHAAGDVVLQEVVRRMHRCLPRDYDWCARLGGEEFAVVLPQTGLEGAATVAERLRRKIEEEPMVLNAGGSKADLTVTIGVSGLEALPERAGATPESLMAHAEQQLFRGKQAGRNQVVVADRIGAG